MGTITLVRHGQANSAATTEADYDRLSDLGHTQAEWLGDWMRTHERGFDHVLSGTLRRHRETVGGMGFAADEDPRLNEIEYYTLSNEMAEKKGIPHPGPTEFADHMPKVFDAWRGGEIIGAETYDHYVTRVKDLLEEAAIPGRRILWVTSGGIIGMALGHVLDLSVLKTTRVMVPIFNTSMHELHIRPNGEPMLGVFNATPHLDLPSRADARTHF